MHPGAARGALQEILGVSKRRVLSPCKAEVCAIEDRTGKINMTNVGALQVGARQIPVPERQSGEPPLRISRVFVLLDMREFSVVD